MLYNGWLAFESVEEVLTMTIQKKGTEQYFAVPAMFLMLSVVS